MNRLSACTNFQMKFMIKSSLIFIAIYIAASVALSCIFTISIDGIRSEGSSSSGFYIGSGIFIFVYVIASYKETFNHLLIFGNTRKNILLSFIITSAAMSVLFSALSALVPPVEKAMLKVFGFGPQGNISLLNLIYKNTGIFSESVWLAAFFFLICSFSLLYSALAYKLGNVFITVFWVCFGLAFLGLPVLLEFHFDAYIIKILYSFFSFGSEHGILLAPVNFIAASALLCISAFLATRRQPQAA